MRKMFAWAQRSTPPKLLSAALAALLVACGGDDDDTPPPPPPNTATAPIAGNTTAPTTNVVAPPGQVMLTVAANSNPPGAIVTGGGRQLGTTPLQTQVPIPAPQPGQVQTFAFTFELAGYQTATLNASPVNNTISITAALAPAVVPQQVGGDPSGDEGDEAGDIQIPGRGGGAIWDNHTTTGFAVVEQPCTIDRLRVRLSGNHTYYGDLHITLRDPQDHSYSLASGGRANPFRTHTVSRAAGRQAQGRWTLAIADRMAQDSGNLRAWSMSIRCR